MRARCLAWAGALALSLWGTGCADPRWADGAGSELARYETQVREWRELAARGFPDARFELDRRIARGELKGDRDAARAGLERAYAADDTRAALELGRLFGDPTFELASEREAVRWLERAREADRPGAARELALRQLDGRGVRRDVPAALGSRTRAMPMRPTRWGAPPRVELAGGSPRRRSPRAGMLPPPAAATRTRASPWRHSSWADTA
jgi:TPR repeat protein